MFIFQFVRLFIILALPSLCLGQKEKSSGDIYIEIRKYKNFNGQSAEYEVGTFYVNENRNDPESRLSLIHI